MKGTLINAAAIIVGSGVGLLLHTKIPERFKRIIFQGIGLFTLFLGVDMAMKSGNYLILIFSVVIGAVIGEWADLEKATESFGERIKNKLRFKNEKFSEGLITAFLMFCMGSMTILGAFEEGLSGKTDLLTAKSVLDGFSSMILAASFGVGVMFAVIPLLLYQGGLTFFAASLQNVLTDSVINEMTGVGGILLIGLGLTILDVKKIKVLNMVPALLIAVILALVFL